MCSADRRPLQATGDLPGEVLILDHGPPTLRSWQPKDEVARLQTAKNLSSIIQDITRDVDAVESRVYALAQAIPHTQPSTRKREERNEIKAV